MSQMIRLNSQNSCLSTELEDYAQDLDPSNKYTGLKSIPEDSSSRSLDVSSKEELSSRRSISSQKGRDEKTKRFRSKSVGSVNSDTLLYKTLTKSQNASKGSNSLLNKAKEKRASTSARSSVVSSRSASPMMPLKIKSAPRVSSTSRTSVTAKTSSHKPRASAPSRTSSAHSSTDMLSRLSLTERPMSTFVPLKSASPPSSPLRRGWKPNSFSTETASMPELYSASASHGGTARSSVYSTSEPLLNVPSYTSLYESKQSLNNLPHHASMTGFSANGDPGTSVPPNIAYFNQNQLAASTRESTFGVISTATIERIKKHIKTLQTERSELVSTIQSMQSKLNAYETNMKDLEAEKMSSSLSHQHALRKMEETFLSSKRDTDIDRQRHDERTRNKIRDLEMQLHTQSLHIQKLEVDNSLLKRENEATKIELMESLFSYVNQMKHVSSSQQQHGIEAERMKKLFNIASKRIETTNDYLDALKDQLKKAVKT